MHFDKKIYFADSGSLEGMKVATSSFRAGFKPTGTMSTSCLNKFHVLALRARLAVLTQNKQFLNVSRLLLDLRRGVLTVQLRTHFCQYASS